MKRNLIYILMSCFIFTFVACSDSIEDATSKHVYSEDENPYLRTDAGATVTTDFEFPVGHFEAQIIHLVDYAAKFQEEMNMTVDQVISGLNDGSVVFYNINSSKGVWNKAATTYGTTGWYYNSAGGVCVEGDTTQTASLQINTAEKTISINVNEAAIAGTILSFNVGFAQKGPDYDSYVRFSFNLSVTDPSIILANITIPTGDYASFGIDLNQYEATIQTCLGMSVSDFLSSLDKNNETPAEGIGMYMVDSKSIVWDVASSYTANPPGYWLNAQGAVCNWNATGFSLFAETNIADQILYIGRAPALASGTKFTISVGYRDVTVEKNFFRFVITATLE